MARSSAPGQIYPSAASEGNSFYGRLSHDPVRRGTIEYSKIYRSLLEVEAMPGDGDVAAEWLRRGLEYLESGDLARAFWCLETASEREPGNGMALRASARALHRLGREKEAFDRLDRAAKIGPSLFDRWLERGFLLMDEEQHAEACWCFEAALEIKDDDPTAWLMRGMMEKAVGRCEDALFSLERSLDLDPQRATAWALTAEVMDLLGRPHEAGLCRETAAKLGL
jgi:tetratricopeptide (TPR) repeat protein